MARSRNIKPALFQNEQLADCNPFARLLFIGLWTEADRNGTLEDRPRKIKIQLLPYDNVDAAELINELVSAGFVARFNVDGQEYLHVLNFKKHQNPHHKEDAKHPLFPGKTQSPKLAPDKSRTSLSLAPDKSQSSPADSLTLIPDCGNLKPENVDPDSAGAKASVASKGKKFKPPTVEEVETYVAEFTITQQSKGKRWPIRPFDADTFVNHYQSNGWKVSRNPMKDWKAAVRSWGSRSFGDSQNQQPDTARRITS